MHRECVCVAIHWPDREVGFAWSTVWVRKFCETKRAAGKRDLFDYPNTLSQLARLLQFAAEDCEYLSTATPRMNETDPLPDCADTTIIRTPSRQELLFARSQVVNAAKAFRLEAIDMVSFSD